MILFLEYYVYVNNVIFFFKKMLGNVKKYYMYMYGLVVSCLLKGIMIFLG